MSKLYQTLLIVSLSLTLTACATSKQVPVPTSVSTSTNIATVGYTLMDVSGHNKATDCWTIIDGSVYNITAYVESGQHPGGNNITQTCGLDSSKIFKNIGKHSSILTADVLKQYYLGLVK